MKACLILVFFILPLLGFAKELTVYSLPMTCSELLPEQEPFISFFEATARGSVVKDKNFAKRIFRLLSLRERINDTPDKIRDQNPVDMLIRKTLCFYREQKEPVRSVPFDDEKYVAFMKSMLPELENKVKDAVFETEYLRASKKQYEAKLKQNEAIVDQMRTQAENEAHEEYDKVSTLARKKVSN